MFERFYFVAYELGLFNSRLFIFISLSLLSFLLSASLTPLIRNLVKRFGLLDHPNKHRNVHKTPMPRVGGIAVFVSFLLPLMLLYLMPTEIVWLERLKSTEFILLFALGSVVFLLGLADDV